MDEQPPFLIALKLTLILTLTLTRTLIPILSLSHVNTHGLSIEGDISSAITQPLGVQGGQFLKSLRKRRRNCSPFPLGLSCPVSRCLFACCCCCCCCWYHFLCSLVNGRDYCIALHQYPASIIVLIVTFLLPLPFFYMFVHLTQCYRHLAVIDNEQRQQHNQGDILLSSGSCPS